MIGNGEAALERVLPARETKQQARESLVGGAHKRIGGPPGGFPPLLRHPEEQQENRAPRDSGRGWGAVKTAFSQVSGLGSSLRSATHES